MSLSRSEPVLLSDNMADCCKTACKICGQAISLSGMRSHTLSRHELQITRYKEIYGQFVIIEPAVYHRCHICDKEVLLDNDFLGAHIKWIHKMKERVYKERYMTYATTTRNYDKPPPSKKIKCEREKKFKTSKDKFQKKEEPAYDFVNTFPDYEYDCNIKHCDLCERKSVVAQLGRMNKEEEGETSKRNKDRKEVITDVCTPKTSTEVDRFANDLTSLIDEIVSDNNGVGLWENDCSYNMNSKDVEDELLLSDEVLLNNIVGNDIRCQTDVKLGMGKGKGDLASLAMEYLMSCQNDNDFNFSDESLIEDSLVDSDSGSSIITLDESGSSWEGGVGGKVMTEVSDLSRSRNYSDVTEDLDIGNIIL